VQVGVTVVWILTRVELVHISTCFRYFMKTGTYFYVFPIFHEDWYIFLRISDIS
jgi:hypothetical protein